MGLTCEECCQTFTSKESFIKHWKHVHDLTHIGGAKRRSKISKPCCLCALCGKPYTRLLYLHDHMRSAHQVDVEDGFHGKCALCGYTTLSRSNFHNHIRNKHSEGAKPTQVVDKPRRFQCSECPAKYCKLFGLKRHQKKVHNTWIPNPTVKRTCPLCGFVSKGLSREEILTHFKNEHDIHIEYKILKFNSVQDFYAWKESIEKLTIAQFRKFSVNSKNVLDFKCARSGNYRPSGPAGRIRRRSYKINSYCPASIKATIETSNEVEVIYQETHVGHENDHHFLRLSREERKLFEIPFAPRARRKSSKSPRKKNLKSDGMDTYFMFHVANEIEVVSEDFMEPENEIPQDTVVSQDVVVPQHVVILKEDREHSEDVVAQQDTVASQNVVVPQHEVIIEYMEHSEDVVAQQDAATPQNVVVPQHEVILQYTEHSEDVVAQQDAVAPQNVVVSQHEVIVQYEEHSEDVVIQQDTEVPQNLMVSQHAVMLQDTEEVEEVVVGKFGEIECEFAMEEDSSDRDEEFSEDMVVIEDTVSFQDKKKEFLQDLVGSLQERITTKEQLKYVQMYYDTFLSSLTAINAAKED